MCDVVAGNFSVIVLPYESSQHLRTYFAPDPAIPEGKDQQILLIPFLTKERKQNTTVDETTTKELNDGPGNRNSSEEAIITSNKGNTPNMVPSKELIQSGHTPCNDMGTTETHSPPPKAADSSKCEDGQQQSVNTAPIKLYCTTLEMMRSVII